MINIISPHLDDAVLSLGQYMAWAHPRVITVFAGVPTDGLTDYDRSCGFESSVEAVRDRRAEDAKACAELGCQPIHLDFLDGQYGPRTAETKRLITEALRVFGDAITFIPLGIGHPDHELVADCAVAALGGREKSLLAYEELPYRVLRPEEVIAALGRVRAQGYEVEQYLPNAGDRERKEAAIACYGSQFPYGANDPCLLVPERAWRVKPCD